MESASQNVQPLYRHPRLKDFQPMGASFGLLPPIDTHIGDKRKGYGMLAAPALEHLAQAMQAAGLNTAVV